jgi:ArsR family transcriptional regulator
MSNKIPRTKNSRAAARKNPPKSAPNGQRSMSVEALASLKYMENFFMALADKTRLRLLNLLRDGEICVCFLVDVLGENQPKISRHLAYLRSAGIVEPRREGKWIHYRLVLPEDPGAARVVENTLKWLNSKNGLQRDYEKLEAVCCAPEAPVTIMRAPKPDIFVQADVNRKLTEDTFAETDEILEPPPKPVRRDQSYELETFLL